MTYAQYYIVSTKSDTRKHKAIAVESDHRIK